MSDRENICRDIFFPDTPATARRRVAYVRTEVGFGANFVDKKREHRVFSDQIERTYTALPL